MVFTKGEPLTSSALNSNPVRTNLDALFEGDIEPLRTRAQASPDMTVNVEGDNDRAYVIGNTPLDFAGGNSSVFTAPAGAGEKQIDILHIDKDGTLTITSGTPTTGVPSPPTFPGNELVVAEIFLRQGMTAVKNTDDATNGYIFKARTPLFNLGNTPYIRLHDAKGIGIDGGTFTSGAWQKRTVTEDKDTGNNVSVASSVLTLEAGTYRCLIRCPAFAVNQHQTRLRNTSDGITVTIGSSEDTFNSDSVVTNSIIQDRFTITTQKDFEIQHRCVMTKTTNGFGVSNNFRSSLYTVAEFWKVG